MAKEKYFVYITNLKNNSHVVYFFVGLIISYIMGFILTWFGIKDQDVANA